MKPILSLALCAGLLWLSGCRSDPNRELLERELRDHEDEIYDLQNQLDDKCHELEACRRKNAALKTGNDSAAEDADERDRAPRRTKPPAEPPAMPKIDLGTPETSPAIPPAKKPIDSPGSARAKSRSVRPAALEGDSTENRLIVGGGPSNAPIERLAINRLMTGGHSFSGKPGDDGLLVVFAPRDRSAEVVQTAGQVSIVAIDPQLSGDEARLARWDFSAPETAAHYRNLLTTGYHFELLWPGRAPQHNELKLYVRFTTADGHQFEDNQVVHVRLPGDPPTTQAWAKPETPNRWSPAAAPIGAQFDPDPPRTNFRSAKPPAAKNPPPAATEPDNDDPPPRTVVRPTWSPYR